jgi:hypothetical protein
VERTIHQGAENCRPGNAGGRSYTRIMTGLGAALDYHLGRAEEHLRLWRDGDQLRTGEVEFVKWARNSG